jgi:CheY-like chemotaxis protein
MTVNRAKNSREALEILDRHPDADVVLMDIIMPIMNGYDI